MEKIQQSEPRPGARLAARLAELEIRQHALADRGVVIEHSPFLRLRRAVGLRFLVFKARLECLVRNLAPRNPLRARLEQRDARRYRNALPRIEGVGHAPPHLPEAPNPAGPVFTLVIQANEKNPSLLHATVESVLRQTWPHWQLHLPDAVDLAGGIQDSRIRRGAGGEAGDYIADLEPGILLAPFALEAFAEALRGTQADLIYSDSDHVNADDRREKPIFRPGWSRALLSSPLYPGAFFLRKRGLHSGWRDNERLCALHVPRLLYHSPPAPVERVVESRPLRPAAGTLVSIVICSRTPQLLERCLASIRQKTNWPHREVVVVHHLGGDEPAMRRVIASAGALEVPFAGVFNFSSMNNLGARACSGQVLVFLNDDIEPITDSWLESLLLQLQCPSVAIAGAKLLYPSGLIQHAGIVVGIGDGCGHVGRNTCGIPWFPWLNLTRDVSAVTGACLAVRRDVFEKLNGFDPRFPVNYNDVDLCLRARQSGYRVIYESAAVLRHDECGTRRAGTSRGERSLFAERWGDLLAADDPFYNPHLTYLHEDAGF